MYFRLLILAVLLTNCLWGQAPAKPIVCDTVFPKIQLSNGTFRLKRLRPTHLSFPFLSTADTFFLALNNPDQIPFKKIEIQAGGKPILHRNISDYNEYFTGKQPEILKLSLKPVFSLRRQFVKVQLLQRQITDTAQSAQCRRTKDSLIRAALEIPQNQPIAPGTKSWLDDKKNIRERIEKIDTTTIPSKKKDLFKSKLTLLPKPGKIRTIVCKDLKKGDTLHFSLSSDEPLKSVWLTKGGLELTRTNNTKEWSHTLLVQDTQSITLSFRGFFSLKANPTKVQITQSEPAKIKLSRSVTDTTYQRKVVTVYDTVLFPVVDQSLVLSPVWDLEKVPFGQIEVQIPKTVGEGYCLQGMAYWLGIERVCLDNYLKFEATVPPDWSKPGVPPALGALALGRPLIFPPIGNVGVVYNFSKSPLSRDRFGKISGLPFRSSLALNAGYRDSIAIKGMCVEGWSQANNVSSYNFYACFQNKSTVDPYPVQLKVVGVYFKRTDKPSEEKGPPITWAKATKSELIL